MSIGCASFGGDVTMMSAVREPGLYQCGVALDVIGDVPPRCDVRNDTSATATQRGTATGKYLLRLCESFCAAIYLRVTSLRWPEPIAQAASTA